MTGGLQFPGFRPAKKLGQNFLKNEFILEKEVRYAGVNERDTVLEVGPGFGNLTVILSRAAGKVVCIEKDLRFRPCLEKMPANVEVVFRDALEVELPAFTKCVSNIPYQISSPFVFKLLEHAFEVAVLGVQKEFGERMVARPGDKNYGRLGASLQFIAKVELLDTIKKGNFYPRPKVDSVIVRITPVKPPDNWDRLNGIISVIFQQPKKILKNAVKNKGLRIPKELEQRRVRTLNREELLEISRLN